MSDPLQRVRFDSADLIETLNRLILDTEEIYMALGTQFPRINRDFNEGFQASSALVAFLSVNAEEASDGLGGGMIATALRDARDVVAQAGRQFAAMGERDRIVFDAIDQGVETISGLQQKIDRIQDDSVELELLSINAMTVAIKAGPAGRGLSYITEELKRLSSVTYGYTEELIFRGQQLLASFGEFRDRVQTVRQFQTDFNATFQPRLESNFNNFESAITDLADFLIRFVDETRGMRKPLAAIMEEIQVQDQIRQSVDHVVLTVREIQRYVGTENGIDGGDRLAVLQALPGACVALLEDVRERIQANHSVFSLRLGELHQILLHAEQQYESFVGVPASGDAAAGAGDPSAAEDGPRSEDEITSASNRLNEQFADSVSSLRELLQLVEQSLDTKLGLTREWRGISRGLAGLQASFHNFDEIIGQFHNIDITARVEIAKHEALRNRSEMLMQMRRFTSHIAEDVHDAIAAIGSSIDASTNVDARQQGLEQDIAGVRGLSERLSENCERLVISKDILTESMGDFRTYIRRFLVIVEECKHEVERLENLDQQVVAIQDALRALVASAAEGSPTSGRALSVSGEAGRRFREIMDRFTILADKKVLGDLAGVAVEGGSQPGELTLF